MSADETPRQDALAWAKTATDDAVQWFMDSGVVDAAVLEAKPAWAVPPAVFIAMLREQGVSDRFFWLIGGRDFPYDYLASSVAASVRDAARHFSLKWQLEAARRKKTAPGEQPESDPEQTAGLKLAEQAESLYRLVSDDALWQSDAPGDPGDQEKR